MQQRWLRSCRRALSALGTAAALTLAAIAQAQQAQQIVELPPPGDERWKPVEFPSIEKHTRYEAVEADGAPAWRAQGQCSASGRAVALDDIDLTQTPILRWRWKVDPGLPRLDERTKAGDDFAARVYVLFRFDPKQASWRERLMARAARALYDTDLPGGALNYVWSSAQARGSDWQSVYQSTSHLVALRAPDDRGWFEERVDLAADRQRFIPEVKTAIAGLAIMTDSDQSCAEATAWYSSIRFEARDAADAAAASPPAP